MPSIHLLSLSFIVNLEIVLLGMNLCYCSASSAYRMHNLHKDKYKTYKSCISVSRAACMPELPRRAHRPEIVMLYQSAC
ncbi:hypothetical protein BDZ85DRAFT_100878 [Elsinoe ampelina]|uniref:Uncharacterized protein n=1 Tax=Elsinoe ampelina TaxID=302913 RepID=A0A6A6GFB1_9PEZI|nr:hypothetical protein BDZ85DRAFT_100878 [Elsinoe ampelina]